MRLGAALAALVLGLASPVLALDLEGNDTPGNWRVKHFETFGIWTSSCDEREEDSTLVQRCYIRHVDVFSPHPKFGAQFLFLTPGAAGPEIEFGMEAGTLFSPNGFRLDRAGETVWRTRRPGCLTGLTCRFEGAGGQELTQQMVKGGDMRFVFRDRHGVAQELTWSLDGFGAAYSDYQNAARLRNLIP